jgi:trans-aconitate methyltransferase
MDLTELKALNFDSKLRHPWEKARMRIVIRILNFIIKKKGKANLTVFDFGCGDVYLSNHIAASFPDCEIHAVDSAFTEDSVQEIRKLTGKASILLYDKIENITLLPEKKADIVLLLDVIEHIEDDAGFLSALVNNKYITRDTMFLITAPAFQCLFSSHDQLLKHYRRYTRKSLIRAINKSDLRSLKSGYFFFVLLFPRIMQLLFGKMNWVKPADKGIGQWNKGIVVSWLLVTSLMIDYFICGMFLAAGINIPGLSVYSICEPAV